MHRPSPATLDFRPFSRSDYPEYLSWFEDERIDAALGPLDKEWLEYILSTNEGADYAVYSENDLVAVIGILIATKDRPYSVITNLAVDPRLFRTGIGSAVLAALYRLHPLQLVNRWVAYVAEENRGTQKFFEKNRWVRLEGVEAGMLTYQIVPGA